MSIGANFTLSSADSQEKISLIFLPIVTISNLAIGSIVNANKMVVSFVMHDVEKQLTAINHQISDYYHKCHIFVSLPPTIYGMWMWRALFMIF